MFPYALASPPLLDRATSFACFLRAIHVASAPQRLALQFVTCLVLSPWSVVLQQALQLVLVLPLHRKPCVLHLWRPRQLSVLVRTLQPHACAPVALQLHRKLEKVASALALQLQRWRVQTLQPHVSKRVSVAWLDSVLLQNNAKLVRTRWQGSETMAVANDTTKPSL